MEARRSKVLNIAHRGASGRCPENTLSAFEAAVAAGADMCEFDVQRTRDGQVVVIHDETVERTTDGRGRVDALTLAEIRRLDAGSWFYPKFAGERVPTLADVVAIASGRFGLNLELKSGGIEDLVCRALRASRLIDTSLISSFDWESLERVRACEPRSRVGLLTERSRDDSIDRAVEMGAVALHPRFDLVTVELCERCHSAGLAVYTWTVDVPELMEWLIRQGVDGIMTNYPDRLGAVLG